MKLSTISVVFAIVSWACSAPALSQVVPGQLAPNYLGKDGNGRPFEVANYRGRVVIATFFASWCGPCKQELPYLEGIQKVFGQGKVKVVGISIEDRDAYRSIRRAAWDMKMEFIHDSDGSVSKAFGREGVPHLLVISKDGILLRQFVGYSEEQIDAVISQVQDALKDQP
jgi:thiol-disulfide isomerase/thioredoxin